MGPRSLPALALGLMVCWGVAEAQVAIEPRARPATPEPPRPKASLRADANLVLVPVTVCDPLNRPVTTLDREHFRVFDDSVEQTVTQFAMDDEPVAVGLVFDTSGSMQPHMRLARKAAAAFFSTGNAGDEFFLVEFNDKPHLAVPLTRDAEQIQNRLALSAAYGRTALLDAIVLALHEMKTSHQSRKALLVVSDGGDNTSRYAPGELKSLVRESDVLIYAIGIYGGGATPEEAAGPALLKEIAEETGGRHFAAEAVDIPDIAAKIGLELRNRYVIGFSPTNQLRDGRYHPVSVKLVPPRGLPPLRAFWRRGYYAPQ